MARPLIVGCVGQAKPPIFVQTIAMSHLQTLYVTDRASWRAWLEASFQVQSEIWLIYPKKATGKPRIEYNTAVEEALCFGWIDSTVRSLDPQHTIQRFCPRRSRSTFSQANKERLRRMLEQNKIHPSLRKAVNDVLAAPFFFPPDIISRIQADPIAWANYQRFSAPYQRIRIAFIDAARKRPEEFDKRLKNFMEKSRQGKMIKGFGGIDKYY